MVGENKLMRNIMYEIPSNENAESVTITAEVLTKGARPIIKYKTPDAQ